MSLRALAPSMSAPAAADEASHARAMSSASVASRRICAAFPASCTALMSSACAGASSSGGAIVDAIFRIARHGSLHRDQRRGRRSGQRLDALERRLELREQVDRRARLRRDSAASPARAAPSDRAPAAAGARRPACAWTAASSAATASGRFPPSSTSRWGIPLQQPLEAEDVGAARPPIRQRHRPRRHRLIRAIERSSVRDRGLRVSARVAAAHSAGSAAASRSIAADRRGQQRRALGRAVDGPRSHQHLFHRFLRRRRRRQQRLDDGRADRRRRRGSGRSAWRRGPRAGRRSPRPASRASGGLRPAGS